LEIKSKNHEKWTEKQIEEAIFNMINSLKLDRMPTQNEMNSFYGNKGLSVVVGRRYGHEWWSKKLGLENKESDSKFGHIWENNCFEYLKTKYNKIEKTGVLCPYDILVNNKIRIDVKSATPYFGKTGYKCHTFELNKKIPTCDIYILYALYDNGIDIERIFIIPSKYIPQISISVGSKSKYDKYIDKWDYIENYL